MPGKGFWHAIHCKKMRTRFSSSHIFTILCHGGVFILLAEYPRVANAATLQHADNKLAKQPCWLEKGVQARLVFRIVVKTVRRFTNKCTQHTGCFVFDARSQAIVQAHWNAQECQCNVCPPTSTLLSRNRTSQACMLVMHVALVPVEGHSNHANQQDTL